ncbi:O-antigen ligase family protein [Desulfosarcina variabilis]|uniref:O-antigen ligase family protein n=1 Tax=Desulfosarcina variabilis TaxID=2300 RepID=UPI003AFB8060
MGYIQLFNLSYLLNIDYPFYARFSFLAIPDSNYSGLYLIFFLCILSYLCQIQKIDNFIFFNFLICLISIILTLSRTTFVVFFVIFFLHFYMSILHNPTFHTSNYFRIFFFFVLALFCIFISIKLFFYDFLKPYINDYIRYTSDLNSSRLTGEIDTFKLRIEIWGHVLNNLSILDTIIGKGDIDIPQWNHYISGNNITLHNLPITLLVKYGIIAPIIYIFFILKITLKKITKINNLQYLIMIIGIGYFLFTLTISDEVGFFLLIMIGFNFLIHTNKSTNLA